MWIKSDAGLTLLEVVVAMVILGVVLIPLMNTYNAGGRAYHAAGRDTELLNLAQAELEEQCSLPYCELQVKDPPFAPYPEFEKYIYKIKVTQYIGREDLKEITVIVKSRNNPQAELQLTTVVAGR